MSQNADNPQPRRNVTDLFRLDGRAALVTGVTGHLGGALAEALAEAGATVVASSRRAPDARGVAEQLPVAAGASHFAVQLDHMDESSARTGFEAALSQAGRLDILVCCGHELLAADWTSVTAEQFNRQLANATGYFLLSRLLHAHACSRGVPASIILL